MSADIFVWPEPVRLIEAVRFTAAAPLRRSLSADSAARARIAKALDLAGLERLDAELALSGWFDGVELEGQWRARISQVCGVTLETFASELAGDFRIRLVPRTSRHAPQEEAEIVIDLDVEDPPEVLESDVIDLGGYVIEHLALEIDPFPRKPDAVFEAPQPSAEISPFAALRALQRAEDSDDESGGG